MDAVVIAVRVALAAMFATAGVTKLRDRVGAERTVGAFGFAPRWRPGVAFAVCVTELATSVLLVLPGLGAAGAMFAVGLLTTFLVALGVQYVRGVEVPCACFGQLAVTPAGLPTLARNVALEAAAVFVLVQLL
jgi:Methylamine utilisation protein MauE